MQHKEKVRELKWNMLCKIADMCISTEDLLPGRESYQLRLNARRVGDEVRVFFYAMGDAGDDEGVSFSHRFKITERKTEKQMKTAVLVLLGIMIVMLAATVYWFHFKR